MIWKLFLSLCLMIGLSAVMTTNAQIQSDINLEVDIPHPFIVGDTTLPAGKYTVGVADDFSNLNVLEIRSVDRRASALFDTESVQLDAPARNSELIFDKIGDNYFLSRVFLSGDQTGNQLVKSRRQKKLEDGGMKAEKHTVAATKKGSKSGPSAKKG